MSTWLPLTVAKPLASPAALKLAIAVTGPKTVGSRSSANSPEETAAGAASDSLICTVAPGGAVSCEMTTFRAGVVAACALANARNRGRMPHALCLKDSLELGAGCE